MTKTHPDRQAKIIYALEKLGANYQRCTQCNAFEGDPSDLHTVTQVSVSLSVILDKETKDERNKARTIVLGGNNQRNSKVALIVCQQCGFSTQYDLEILEQHL